MAGARYDVVGIGNAIVDILSFCDEAKIAELNLTKGAMTLIDEAAAEKIYRAKGPSKECSGGSVANSLAGLASLGAKCAFIGKVKRDQLGEIFRHDMHASGVHFDTPAASTGPATARCLIFVTPDAQRTMNTFIGACSMVSEADIDVNLISNSEITYVEGYLWDQPAAKDAILKALDTANHAGRKVAFTLSDTFCVERHRSAFLELIANSVHLLFANEAELKALLQTNDIEAALKELQGMCPVAAVTRSEKGCSVVTAERIEHIPTSPVAEVIDTTGAGDLFAAGFLYGFTRGWPMKSCAALGNRCAGTIIQQVGARSMKPLNTLLAA